MQPLWKKVRRFLKTLGIELPYDPAMPMLGIHPEETRTVRYLCTPMFTAALFTIVKTWKQLKCPSADEWIKMWCIYTMEYYSVIKKNEMLPFAATRMDLEIIILSEMSQIEKGKCHMILFICEILKSK